MRKIPGVNTHIFKQPDLPWGGSGIDTFLIIGDSIAEGHSPAPGPDATNANLYEYTQAGSLSKITTNDLESVNGSGPGSQWPRFGIEHNLNTGKMTVLVNAAVGGTDFVGDWDDGGASYATAKTQAEGALAAVGNSSLSGIFLNCGINDWSASTALSTVETSIDELVANINTDFPNIPVYVVQMGVKDRSTPVYEDALMTGIRRKIRDVCFNNAKFEIVTQLAPYAEWGLYLTSGDGRHLNADGNDKLGRMLARALTNTTYSKYARSIINSHFTDLNNAQKNAINTFIETVGADFELLFNFNWLAAISANDLFVDWSLLNAPTKTGGTLTAKDNLAFNGSSDFFNTRFTRRTDVAQDNDFMGVKVGTVVNNALEVICGSTGANESRYIAQATDQIRYVLGGATPNSVANVGGAGNDNNYFARQSSGTASLLKNGTSIDSLSDALATENAQYTYIGARLDSDDVEDLFFEGEVVYCMEGTYSGMDFSNIEAALNTLQTSINNS